MHGMLESGRAGSFAFVCILEGGMTQNLQELYYKMLILNRNEFGNQHCSTS